MNTESRQDQAPSTTGGRLRQARENMGLSQPAVAERLCLKVSIVRDIEDDHVNPNIATTFLRGYIRYYARLVHISEEELMPFMPMMVKQVPIKVAPVAPMQNFLRSKSFKKRDVWLMGFTWLILFVVVSLTCVWWWQNHQAQQQDIASMAYQYSAQLSQVDDVVSSPLDVVGNVLVMNFIGDCWLEVFDAADKKLFSGIQHTGGRLNLTGKAPYQLKIGTPAAVQVQYQGKPVDLSGFIRSNQVARLIVAAQ